MVNVAVFALLIRLGMHYLPADALGIITAFSANFLIANRFVFTASVPWLLRSPSAASMWNR